MILFYMQKSMAFGGIGEKSPAMQVLELDTELCLTISSLSCAVPLGKNGGILECVLGIYRVDTQTWPTWQS